jgi:hypothetical protein
MGGAPDVGCDLAAFVLLIWLVLERMFRKWLNNDQKCNYLRSSRLGVVNNCVKSTYSLILYGISSTGSKYSRNFHCTNDRFGSSGAKQTNMEGLR